MPLRKEGSAAWAEAASVLATLPIEFHPATHPLAAALKAGHPFSLANAFAAALEGIAPSMPLAEAPPSTFARLQSMELVTGDPEFKAVEKEIKIVWLKLRPGSEAKWAYRVKG